jgi:aryl-alcohol dehydrogenase-like predicted oxidoreductase
VEPEPPQQVEEYVGAVGVTFGDDELTRIDAILGGSE